MPLDASKMRSFVEDFLRKNKSRTEREVKNAVAKAFRTKPAEIGAAIIRDVRKKMGIDRPTALAYARSVLAKDPATEARRVIDAVGQRFGIRLGPPDVSRLRPRRPKVAGLARPGRPQRSAAPAAAGKKAISTARTAKPRRRGRAARRVGNSGTKVQLLAAAAPPRSTPPNAIRKAGTGRGEISMTFEGKGNPEDLAAFFLSLSHRG